MFFFLFFLFSDLYTLFLRKKLSIYVGFCGFLGDGDKKSKRVPGPVPKAGQLRRKEGAAAAQKGGWMRFLGLFLVLFCAIINR